MNNTDKKKYILLLITLVLAFVVIKELRPYFSGFLGAITLYVLLRPQLKALTVKRKWGKSLAATFLTLEALLCFLIPISGIAFLVVDTLSGVSIDTVMIKQRLDTFIQQLELKTGIEIFTPENIKFVSKIGGNLVQALVSSLYSLIINIVIIVFVLFYMLYQSEAFENLIRDILPFSENNKSLLVKETQSIILANAIGIPLLAVIQGIFAYLGYKIFGINSALLYAILTGFASLIPVVGTMAVWVPLVIVEVVAANYLGAIGLTIYGLVVIGGVDNVARFILQKQLADIHPLITVFGVLLGIPMFGFWGLIFGPLLISLLFLCINLYRYEYIPNSKCNPFLASTKKKETKHYIDFHKLFRKKSKR
ncbi:MAG: AI-2E family transporter [Lentimicrobiaceae bacterium]|nr:AI-2E family transporter [Lentimicrobiaceae bacterium]